MAAVRPSRPEPPHGAVHQASDEPPGRLGNADPSLPSRPKRRQSALLAAPPGRFRLPGRSRTPTAQFSSGRTRRTPKNLTHPTALCQGLVDPIRADGPCRAACGIKQPLKARRRSSYLASVGEYVGVALLLSARIGSNDPAPLAGRSETRKEEGA